MKTSGFKRNKFVCKSLKNLSKSPFVKPVSNGKSEKYTFEYTNEQLCRLNKKTNKVKQLQAEIQKASASPKHFTKDAFYVEYDHHHKRREKIMPNKASSLIASQTKHAKERVHHVLHHHR